MAITPATGYQVDPSNPNGVIPAGSQQPPATNSLTPAPQIQTPAAPAAQVPIGQTPAQAAAATTAATTTSSAPQPATGTTPLAMPANGSVVDLLNAAGQDSAYAARQNLAKQYGIQGYTGTAAQNTDLSKKYLEAYNANKSTAAPQSGAQAASVLDSYFTGNADVPHVDPQSGFIDAISSMNPVVSSLYNQINQILSAPATTQTFADEYQQLVQAQGIPALQSQLMNVQNLMDGTEDSIREEITNAGGFASENQVQALAAARNKTFLKQANSLQQQLALKQDYVNQIMSFTQADRADVEKQVNQKLGLTTQLIDLQDKMTNAAKDNYKNIIANVGYAGLASALKDNPQQQSKIEGLLGLPTGALSNQAFLGQQDAGKILGSASTGYFTYNPYTGETTPIAGGNGGTPNFIPSGTIPTTGNGNGVPVPTLNGKPLTDTQSTTLGYAQRLSDSDKIITQLGGQFTGLDSYIGGVLPNFLKSSDRQQYEQAQRNFINAVLRKESGAAISPSEFDSAAKQYFPQPGDSQAVVNQKTDNRQRVIATLSQSANVPETYVNQAQSGSGGSYQDYLKAIGQ